MQKHKANRAKARSVVATVAAPQLVHTKERQNGGEAYYYVFSDGCDFGYTIVSGDDRLPEIVGYTESGLESSSSTSSERFTKYFSMDKELVFRHYHT